MRTSFMLLLSFLFIFYSCQDKSVRTVEHHDHYLEENHSLNQLNVTLNDGEKWHANAETNRGINTMLVLVNNVPANPAPVDCEMLQEKLEHEFDRIIEECTMKGEAHHQLHNYLIPLKSYISRLSIKEDENCRITIMELQEHLKEYNNYFI
jgi:hypothetical protein